MTVKFKIGFTIDAETMFSIVSKFLPLEDLAIEEVVERPVRPDPAIRFDKRFDLPKPNPTPSGRQLAKPKRARSKRGEGPNLTGGVNAIIVKFLSDGQPHRAVEIKPLIEAQGYSESGIGSRLERLREHKVVFQPEIGLWQLTEAYLKTEAA